MKSGKLLDAIGEISDEMIADAAVEKRMMPHRGEKTDSTWNVTSGSRRMLRLGIAVALIAGLLGTAALASSMWFFDGYHPQVDDSWDAVTPTDDNGVSHIGSIYIISFSLPLNEDAPELIETYYFPQVPDIYEQSFGAAYTGMNFDKLGSIIYAWDIPDGAIQGMMFYQESGFDSNVIETHVTGTPDIAPELKETELGGVEGVLIVEPVESDYPDQYFYWSDGEYVFHMRFPIDFTEEQMAQIIGSVHEVEDVRPYLISMTEEDLEKTFG